MKVKLGGHERRVAALRPADNALPFSLSSVEPSDWRMVFGWLSINLLPKINAGWRSEPFADIRARHETYTLSVADEINTGGRPPSIIGHWLVPALDAICELDACSINEASKRLKSERGFGDRHLPEADALRRAYYRIKRGDRPVVPRETFSWYILAGDHLIAAMSFQYLTPEDREAMIAQLDGFCLKPSGGSRE